MYLISHLDLELTIKPTVIPSPRSPEEQTITKLQIPANSNMPASSSASTMTSVRTRSMIKDRKYFAEKVVDEKLGENGKTLYLVKWEGYSLEEATWEPRRNLTSALMSAWRDGLAQKAQPKTDGSADGAEQDQPEEAVGPIAGLLRWLGLG